MKAIYEVLRIGTYPFRYPTYRLARFILDYQIKSALNKPLSTKTRDNVIVANDSDRLFQLLQIAASSANLEDVTYKQLMAYHFFKDDSLGEYLLAHEKNAIKSQKKLAAQTDVRNIALLYTTQSTLAQEKPTVPSFTLGQRLLKWFLKSSFDEKRIFFNSSGFDSDILSKLKENESGKVVNVDRSLNESYSPQDMLSTEYIGTILQLPDTIDQSEFKEINLSLNTGPNTPNLIIEMEANYNTIQDQVEVIATQNEVTRDLRCDEELGYREATSVEMDLVIDRTRRLNINELLANLREERYFDITAWIYKLNHAISNKVGQHSGNSTLGISELALSMLKQCDPDCFDLPEEVDLEYLPLGFFFDQQGYGSSGRLCYSAELRARQLNVPQIANMRLDILANNPKRRFKIESEFDERELTSRDLKEKLGAKNIALSDVNQSFFNWLDSSTEYFEKNNLKISYITYRALYRILDHPESKGQHIKGLIDSITAMQKKNFDIDGRTKNLFHVFSGYYLSTETNITSFGSAEAMEYLKKISNASGDEIILFFLLSIGPSGAFGYNDNFIKTARRTFYFMNFLAAQGITLPKNGLDKEGYHMFAQPESIMGCLAIVKQQHPKLLPWMGEHMHVLPRNLVKSKLLLKAGYSFVHRAMYFDNDLKLDKLRSVTDAGQESLLNYPFDYWQDPNGGYTYSYFVNSAVETDLNKYIKKTPLMKRAAFLRYLAYHVQDAYVVAMIERWERFVGSLEQPENEIGCSQEQWLVMVDEVSKLPKRTQKMIVGYVDQFGYAERQSATKKQDRSKKQDNWRYEDEDIDRLFDKLKSGTSASETLPIDDLKAIVNRVNDHAVEYRQIENLTSDVIKSELAKINNDSSTEQLQFAQRVSLIREVYCRMSGKWLRLEQLVAIRLGIKHDMCLQIDTSEGKTMIIGWTALLKALSGKTVDVLTHNKAFAKDNASELAPLAERFGIHVAIQTAARQQVSEAIQVLYVDIATAIFNYLFNMLENNPTAQPVPEACKATDALLDEGDNIVLDIQAGTTMQLSTSSNQEADPSLVQWVSFLNKQVREGKLQETNLKLLKANYSDCNWNDADFVFWIKAAEAASVLQKDKDYVVHRDTDHPERSAVYIVHKKTTGNVDRESKWGEGVHTCVSAWEQAAHDDIYIPGISEVQASSDVITYLQNHYVSRTLYSGTLGDDVARKRMKDILKFESVIQFPRAKRPETENIIWPKGPGAVTIYSRRFLFPPMICPHKTHFSRILEALKKMQAQEKSCLVFWNTIDECNQFANYLRRNGISDLNIQIFDDARDEASQSGDTTRPDSTTIIEQAKSRRMITLGTAVAGRGVNFRDVQYAIIAKPGLKRVTDQKTGRVGRDTDLASVYEIYDATDLNLNKNRLSSEINPITEASEVSGFRVLVEDTETLLEDQTLAKLPNNDGYKLQ